MTHVLSELRQNVQMFLTVKILVTAHASDRVRDFGRTFKNTFLAAASEKAFNSWKGVRAQIEQASIQFPCLISSLGKHCFFTCSLSYLINFRSWQQDSWRSFRLRGFSAQSNDAPSKSFGSSFESLQILQSLAGITPFTTLSRTLKENEPLEKIPSDMLLFLPKCKWIRKIWKTVYESSPYQRFPTCDSRVSGDMRK